jgi:hypothetical protein
MQTGITFQTDPRHAGDEAERPAPGLPGHQQVGRAGLGDVLGHGIGEVVGRALPLG